MGLVIVVALIIVAVKQAETGPPLEEEEARVEPRTPEEVYQGRLLELFQLVTECQSLVVEDREDRRLDCQPFLAAATPTTVDTLIQNLANLIQDIKLNQTVEHISKFQSALENLDISEDVNNTNYKTILEILQPVIRDQDIANPQPRSSLEDGQKTFVTSLVTSSNSSRDGGAVVCDWRERRCRDGLKCYLASQHCDLNVDCEDNSDEDSCDCVELLVGSRLCDGYLDCEGGEDEADCRCPPGTSFFCGEDSSVSGPRCVSQSQVCDGAADCLTGRDEEDCTILATSLNTALGWPTGRVRVPGSSSATWSRSSCTPATTISTSGTTSPWSSSTGRSTSTGECRRSACRETPACPRPLEIPASPPGGETSVRTGPARSSSDTWRFPSWPAAGTITTTSTTRSVGVTRRGGRTPVRSVSYWIFLYLR